MFGIIFKKRHVIELIYLSKLIQSLLSVTKKINMTLNVLFLESSAFR